MIFSSSFFFLINHNLFLFFVFFVFLKMDCARLSWKNSMASAPERTRHNLTLLTTVFTKRPLLAPTDQLTTSASLKWQVTQKKKARNCDSGGDPKERWGLSPLCPAWPPAYWAMNPLWRSELEDSRILILSLEFWLRGQFLPGLEISNFDSESWGDWKTPKRFFFVFFRNSICF